MLHPREDYARIQDPAGLIPEDEPVFLLRAQDKVASATVNLWADLNEKAGGDPKLTEKAREHAFLMGQWPVHKLADLPASSADKPVPTKEDEQKWEQEYECQQQGDQGPGQQRGNSELTAEQKQAIINEHVSHLPEKITDRTLVIASAGIFDEKIKTELAIALDCPVDKVPEALADHLGFTAAESETRPGSGIG